MSQFVQEKRSLQLKAPFDEKGVVLSLIGHEGISELFTYECIFLSTKIQIPVESVIGESVSIICEYEDERENKINKYFHGIVSSFVQLSAQQFHLGSEYIIMRQYKIDIVPGLALLKNTKHSRVFQKKSQNVMDIVKKILKPFNLDIDDVNVLEPPKQPFCIQYQESDFDFVERILAETGIYYYFKCDKNKHKIVFGNNSSGYENTSTTYGCGSYFSDNTHVQQLKYTSMLCKQKIASDNLLLDKPSQKLEKKLKLKTNHGKPGEIKECVEFIYPGSFDTSDAAASALKQKADQAEAMQDILEGRIAKPLNVGEIITLEGGFGAKEKEEYVVIHATINLEENFGGFDALEEGLRISCLFKAIKASRNYKPIAKPFPAVATQLGVVVNSKGNTDSSEPFYHNELGHVCVKFAWEDYDDETLKPNHYDQCYFPIIHTWDNGVYRVGTRVAVNFLYNDLNRPVIIGTINMSDNLLLGKYSSENRHTSVLQRMPGVETQDYNYVKFEDKKDTQKLSLVAPKDLYLLSLNETYETENHERQVKKKYEMSCDERQETVNTDYHLTMKNFVIEGDVSITGNVKIKGKLDIT